MTLHRLIQLRFNGHTIEICDIYSVFAQTSKSNSHSFHNFWFRKFSCAFATSSVAFLSQTVTLRLIVAVQINSCKRIFTEELTHIQRRGYWRHDCQTLRKKDPGSEAALSGRRAGNVNIRMWLVKKESPKPSLTWFETNANFVFPQKIEIQQINSPVLVLFLFNFPLFCKRQDIIFLVFFLNAQCILLLTADVFFKCRFYLPARKWKVIAEQCFCAVNFRDVFLTAASPTCHCWQLELSVGS